MQLKADVTSGENHAYVAYFQHVHVWDVHTADDGATDSDGLGASETGAKVQ